MNWQNTEGEGIIVCDLKSGIASHPEYIKKAFSQYPSDSCENGFFIMISDGVIVDKPIVIHHQNNNSASNVNVFRNLIIGGKGSRFTLLELFDRDSEAPSEYQSVTQIELREHAHCHHIHNQNADLANINNSDIIVEQSAYSNYRSIHFSLGAKSHRQTWQINLNGEQAHSSCQGLSIVHDAQLCDYQVTMNHVARSCTSNQQFKAIAHDKARAKYNGKVVVQSTGQQAIAHQQSRNLLLSSNAEINTLPELEIYTDDVKCSHGASVGQIDDEQLFYLQSRGIRLDQAKALLLRAFIHDQIETLSPEIQELIMPSLEAKLVKINGGQC